MSLHLASGRLTIDQDGVTSFDSDDELYHNITTGISGNYSVPNRSASKGHNININTNHLIGSCNAFCTHVCGSVKFTGAIHSLPANVWFSYEGGDLFWSIDYHSGIQNPAWTVRPTGIVKYRFFVSGGNVYLNERSAFKTFNNLTVSAHTIYWNLKAGRFN